MGSTEEKINKLTAYLSENGRYEVRVFGEFSNGEFFATGLICNGRATPFNLKKHLFDKFEIPMRKPAVYEGTYQENV